MPALSQKTFRHRIVVERPFAEAIHLFTPRGEEAWVPGWSPTYIAPTSGETTKEMLFVTGDGPEKTFWTCLDWQPEEGRVRYLRLTPETRVAFVEVTCEPEGETRTFVSVAYDVQALTEAGNDWLASFSEEAFTASIDEWADLIARNV